MQFIDTHCHIHDREFFTKEAAETAYQHAVESLEALVLVGTSLADSRQAVDFAGHHSQNCFVAVGIHPHEATKMLPGVIADQAAELAMLATDKTVHAIGECGFDFYYNDRSGATRLQTELLEMQLQIASNLGLPVSFHVREAFDEFWPVFRNFPGLRGVLHSFTDTQRNLDIALSHGLLIGINGIATFTSHAWQRDIFATVPLDSVVLETDAPFLTPSPIRGTINEPRNVTYITKFLAELREDNEQHIATITTANARNLFGL